MTINVSDKIPDRRKETIIDTSEVNLNLADLNHLIIDCGAYYKYECINQYYFNCILRDCAKLCEYYGYNFEVEMIKTIKEISSLTGDYDEKVKKWYQANYEKAANMKVSEEL